MELNSLIGMGILPPLFPGESSIIQSIEYVPIVIAIGAISNTATLATPVTKGKSICIDANLYTANSTRYDQVRTEFTLNALGTIVTASVGQTSGDQARNTGCYIIQFKPWAIKGDVEWGTRVIAPSTSSVSSAAGFTPTVDRNTFCVSTGQLSIDTGQNIINSWAKIDYDFATNVVSASALTTITGMTCGYCLWEFELGIVDSKQEIDCFFTSNGTSNTIAIPNAITLNRAVSFYGSYVSNGAFQEQYPEIHIADDHTVGVSRFSGANGTSSGPKITIGEFNSRWIKQVQRAVTSIGAANTTLDVTLSPTVDTTKSWATYLGQTNQNGFANLDYILTSVKVQSSSAMRMQRVNSNTFYGGAIGAYQPSTVSWEVPEFY